MGVAREGLWVPAELGWVQRREMFGRGQEWLCLHDAHVNRKRFWKYLNVRVVVGVGQQLIYAYK